MIKGNIDDVLKSKLNETEIKKYISIDMLEAKSNKHTILKIACISSILIIMGVIIFNNEFTEILQNKIAVKNNIVANENDKKNNDIIHSADVSIPKNMDDVIEYNSANINTNDNILSNDNKLKSDSMQMKSNLIVKMENESFGSIGQTQYILVVKINSILGSTNYSTKINNYAPAVTKVKATVIACLKGDYSGNDIEFYTLGGNIKISDYENVLLPSEKAKLNIDKMSQNEKENKYITVIPKSAIGISLPEVSNTYIVSLTNDNLFYNGLSVVASEKCNFKLYDTNTNKYKDSFGNWVIPEIQ